MITSDFDRIGYYGADYGTMKPYHKVGSLLFLSGHVAQIGAQVTHKGRLGADLTTEQGYAAARQTGLNVRLGTLDASIKEPTTIDLPNGSQLVLEPLQRSAKK